MRILVVEDEPKLAASLNEGLREAHYTVDVAPTAGRRWTCQHVDLRRDDPRHSASGGRRFSTSAARCESRGTTRRFSMLTARDAVADKWPVSTRRRRLLTKPFVFDELLARLRALLRRNGSQKDGLFRVADLTLDPAARAVRRGRPSRSS